MGATVVSLRDVGKTFDSGTVALHGLDLDLHAGEFVSLLGASGCGKSTVLRIVAGLSRPSHGTVTRNLTGRSGRDGDPPRDGIGFVFQEPTLMPWADVFANVHLPLKLAGCSRAAATAQVEEALARTGLADFAHAYPRELSGGMRMRVSIARALVTRPRLLLMDEPFAALDEITRFRLNDDLIALWRELGMTVLFVTHSVFESVYLSQRILTMTPRPGRVFAAMGVDASARDRHFRTSAEYGALCRQASELLEQAMQAEPAS